MDFARSLFLLILLLSSITLAFFPRRGVLLLRGLARNGSGSSSSASDVFHRNAKFSVGGDLFLFLSSVFQFERFFLEVPVDGYEDLAEEFVFAQLLVEDSHVHCRRLSSDDDRFLELGFGFLELFGLDGFAIETDTEIRKEISRQLLARVDRHLESTIGGSFIQERLNFGNQMFIKQSGRGLSHGNHIPFGWPTLQSLHMICAERFPQDLLSTKRVISLSGLLISL